MNFTLSTPGKRSLRPTDHSKSFAKLKHMSLSAQEEKVIELLRQVEHDSFWGLAIRNSFVDKSVEGMRELICQLLSQADDNEDSMFRILGGECYRELIKLKP